LDDFIISPVVGSISPAKIFNDVDFPPPLGPTKPTLSPGNKK